MAIRQDLLYKENIITQSQLEQIINPFNDELLEKYGSDIGLSGYVEVVNQFIKKINSFIEYGNFNKYNKNYKEEVEEQKIIRYRKKVNDNEYINCLADDEGAEPYEYTYTTKKYVEIEPKYTYKGFTKVEVEQDNDNVYSELDIELPAEFEPLKKCDITVLLNNIEKIKYLLYNEKAITKKVALSLIDDIVTGIENAKQENFNQYTNKQYFNKDIQIQNLPLLKKNYISYYNEYEDLMARQSLFVKKAKHTNGSELDKGL